MIPLLTAILVSSLIGSVHCVGMCGALVALAIGMDRAGAAVRPMRLQAAYHLGRLLGYVSIGAAAGGVGSALDLGGRELGLERVAAIIAGALMIAFGVTALARSLGAAPPAPRLPGFAKRFAQAGHRAAWALRPLPRAAAIGLLTPLLPCGWLYAFAVVAAGTAHPLGGMAVMGTFWLGTVPALAALGAGLRAMSGPLRARMPALTSVLLIVVGGWTVVHRLSLPAFARDAGHGAITGDRAALVERAASLAEQTPACCRQESGIDDVREGVDTP